MNNSFFSFFCFLVLILLSPSSFLADHGPELVNEICSQTSNFTFCVDTLNSDPQTADAGYLGIAIVTFRLASINATTTRSHILKLLSSCNDPTERKNLQRCVGDYNKAVSDISTGYNDLNSETVYELADLANDASLSAQDCESSYNGLASMNKDLKGICEICVVIANHLTGGS
ncbi:hypothetical protein K1719_042336 [Acacia pycnantha]|nr:hypothetical protein K1719_042336 [Acacia pycnantha]